MHKILVMRLYFLLDVYACCMAVATQQAYTKCDVQLIKLLLMMN